MKNIIKLHTITTAILILFVGLGNAFAEDSGSLKTIHNPPQLVDSTQFGYSQAVSVPTTTRTIYVAGQVGYSPDGPNDFKSQVDRSFENLLIALRAAGGKPENIVRITLLIVDHNPEKLAYVGEKRRETFGDKPPASVLIPVTKLYADGVSFEISAVAVADTRIDKGALLKFSDGRPGVTDITKINEILMSVGVRLEQIDVPKEAIPLLRASMTAPLSAEEKERVLKIFYLSREEVLKQVRLAGRQPVLADGGSMTSGEVGVAPYPKVYDLKSMGPDDRLGARNKFGRLHINSTDDMTGVDEVMTLPVGGPWTWYFQLTKGVTVELQMAKVMPGEKAWRLSYPGLTPHGAYFHAEEGLCIAYITGPKIWTMRYEAAGFENAEMLGENPFIDFTSE